MKFVHTSLRDLFFLFWLSTAAAFAEERVLETQTYADGSRSEVEVIVKGGERIPDGKAVYFYANGQRRAEGRHSKGQRVGRWQGWHANGERASTGKYKGGERSGVWRFFDSQGKSIEHLTGTYEFVERTDHRGVTRYQGYLVDGQRQGPWRVDWWTGQVLAYGAFVDGQRSGPWCVWHPDGQPAPLLGSGVFEAGVWSAPNGPEAWEAVNPREGDLPAPSSFSQQGGSSYEPPSLDSKEMESIRNAGDTLATWEEPARAQAIQALTAPFAGHSLGWDWGSKPESAALRAEVLRSIETLRQWYRTSQAFWLIHVRSAQPAADPMAQGALFRNLPLFPFEWGREAGDLPAGWHLRRSFDHAKPKTLPERLAVEDALEWLASEQGNDGFWRITPGESIAEQGMHVGLTSLAVLAFLGAGESPLAGPYADRLLTALDALARCQNKKGVFYGSYRKGKRTVFNHVTYQHALATLAFCEAYGMTGHPAYRDIATRGLAILEDMRAPYGAWRYEYPSKGKSDTSVTSWAIQAYFVAEQFGLPFEREGYLGALEWVDSVTDEGSGRVGYIGPERGGPSSRLKETDHFYRDFGEAMTGAGLSMRRMMRWGDDSVSPIEEMHAELILRRPLSFDEFAEDSYYAYFGTLAEGLLASSKYPRNPLPKWRAQAIESILKRQEVSGQDAGSWNPTGAWGVYAGRVYATCMYTLAIENQWRYRVPVGGR